MTDAPIYIAPEQLRVGIFVELEVSWWQHDFAFNSFKIKDEEQLKELQELGLKRVKYDPARSDCEPLTHADDVIPTPVLAPKPAPTLEEKAARMRAVKLGILRSRLGEVDKKFVEASQRVKALNAALLNQPENAVAMAGVVVRDLVEAVIGEDGAALHTINGKAADDAYVHSLNVTVLSVMLGRQLGLNAEDCHTLGLGALLHDIGKTEVPSQVLLKTEPRTRPEQKLFELHTEFGVRRGHRLMLDDEVLGIIHDHHERCDGSGYPRQLFEASIGRLTRLVCITNHYDNLCNPLNPKLSLSPHEALSRMFSQERAKFDDVALRAFIRCMGVHPPGSVVKLNDDRHALVLGMHPTLPMRPTLIVFDPKIPKEEALIVNLEQEPQLSITGSVRLNQLSPQELAYLNPRQQVTYYVDPRTRSK